jgi:hypothetical protein
MYYIEKLNNDEYPMDKKRLSVKYDFKCVKQPLSSLYCRYYMCEHLKTCGQYKVNREDVSHHCFIYLYFVSLFFHCLLTSFLLHQFPNYIVEWNYSLQRICKTVESIMLYQTFACSCIVRSFIWIAHSSTRSGR